MSMPAGSLGSPGPGPHCARQRHFTADDWPLASLCLRVPSCFSASFNIPRSSPEISHLTLFRRPPPPPSSLPRNIEPSIMPSEKRSQPHDAEGRETQQRSRKRERYTRIAWLVPLCTHTDSPRHAPMQDMQDILTTYRPQANAHPQASPARRGRSSAAAACHVADVWSSTPIANTTTMFRSPTPRTTRLCSIIPLSTPWTRALHHPHSHEHVGAELLTMCGTSQTRKCGTPEGLHRGRSVRRHSTRPRPAPRQHEKDLRRDPVLHQALR